MFSLSPSPSYPLFVVLRYRITCCYLKIDLLFQCITHLCTLSEDFSVILSTENFVTQIRLDSYLTFMIHLLFQAGVYEMN